MDIKEKAMKAHEEWRGKIEVIARMPVENRDQLSVAYTPGVAEPCLAIQKDYDKSFTLTRRWNTVAVVTDGTAVLGLGDIGPEAGMPVMEGKCVLFKTFGDVDAFPICIRSKDVDEIVRTVYLISGGLGGVNLEDIAAPRCFEIERRLTELCDIPIFHDDQHGTAVVVAAALINAMRVVGRKLGDEKIVIVGAGAAGVAVAKLLLSMGAKNIILTDRSGVIYKSRPANNSAKEEIAAITNPGNLQGTLADAMRGADVFIGLSGPGVVTQEMVESMNEKAVVLAMSNPTPEIMPDLAKAAGAAVVGTGRSDFPNQINNVLCFPGLFRGALDCRASRITEEMKIAAAHALADLISPQELTAEYIIPAAFDKRVGPAVAKAVEKAARDCGVARI